VRKAWAPTFMVVANKLSPSFICGASSYYEEGAQLAGRTCRAQIAVRTVSVESYSTDSEYCGRVSPLELSFSRALWLSGLGNIVRRAHLLHLDLCFSVVQVVIVSGSSVYCTCCIPPSILHIYTLRFETSFPREGFIQGHVDQRYLCSFSCMLVFRTALFQH
jgi:hypothetical protein